MKKYSHRRLWKACVGRWLWIFQALTPDLWQVLINAVTHVPCPWHGGIDGFRRFPNFPSTGGAICNSCGAYPTGFKLLAHHLGISEKESLRMVARLLRSVGSLPVETQMDHSIPTQSTGSKAHAIEAVLAESVPISHEIAEPARLYLRSRGILNPNGICGLLYHPHLQYRRVDGTYDTFPAMIAKVRLGNDVVSLHRTYLTQDGHKAPVASPKKLMSPVHPGATTGAAIRLFPPPYIELALTEGIETGLAYQNFIEVPTWAALSANGLKNIQVPETVRHVLICGDNDHSGVGQEAAEVCAYRLRKEGRHVEILIPPGPIPEGQKSLDWADVIKAALP